MKPPPPPRGWKRDTLRIAVVLGTFAVVAMALQNELVRANLFDIATIRENLHPDDSLSDRYSSAVVFIAVSSVLVALGMPRMWVSTVAGALYGAAMGIVLGLIASVIGAIGTYYIGFTLLRSIVRRRLRVRYAVWFERLEQRAFMWILMARFFPISNATLTSLLCGSCRVPAVEFIGATALGFIPMTVVCAIFGSAMAKGSLNQSLLATLFFLITFYLQRRYTKAATDRASRQSPAPTQPMIEEQA